MNIFHFFIPHHKNNHRAKLLHNLTLFILIVSTALVSSLSVAVHRIHPEVLGISYQISDNELLNLTNFEREQNGLPALSYNKTLEKAAKKKGEHMFKYNYWSHYAPDGTSPWDFIKGEGYDYTYAGENLAKGFTTSYDTIKAWMASPTHKENILSSKYSEVGFAILEGRLSGEDTILVVQEFGATDNLAGTDTKSLPDTSSDIVFRPAEVQGSYQISLPSPPSSISRSISKKPLIDVNVLAKSVTFLLLSALLIALILDFVIIEKKKIPRIVGNNLDHLILVTLFIAFVFMAKLGHVI